MTDDRLTLAELLAKAGDGDFLRSVAEAVVQLLMETDMDVNRAIPVGTNGYPTPYFSERSYFALQMSARSEHSRPACRRGSG